MPTFHLRLSTIRLNGGILAGSLGRSLLNISEMFRRIGSQKPKIFGIMDLTQGYHQAPLTLPTRAYTSFITLSGVYQFTRLPFGPKHAPSYFQEITATVVW